MNKFAISNKDIVEALTRSSSAMKAANNTFEETVALATAAIEITRDASSVGNGLKTLSMRIRGYDEETEEFSQDIAVLTGEIANLTKVASNGNRGISLFEIDNPEKYRSTYDILSDIADIWDELTDKNRAQLLEALFGKRQAQIGSAILSNFDQARSAIQKMEDSLGSADREMEKIKKSLTYKLNALKETWVGVARNLFQTDSMKFVVDRLTNISNAVDWLTNYLGLFGTTAVTVLGVQFVKSVLSAKNAVEAAKIAIAGLKFDSSNLNEYVYALAGLSKKQQELVLSTTNLSNAQKAAIMKEVAAIKEKTAAQLASILKTNEEAALNKLNIHSIKELTKEKLKAALASEQITQAEYDEIMAAGLLNLKNMGLIASFKALATNALAAMTAMLHNPVAIIMGITMAVSLVVNLWQKAKQAAEEARQAMNDAANAANNQRNSLADLIAEYKKLASAGDFDASARETAQRIQKDITDLVGKQAENLDLVNGKLDDEIEKLDAIRLQNAYNARDTLDTKYRDAQSRYNAGIDADGSGTNFLGVVTDESSINEILKKIGYINEAWENVNGQISFGYALAGKNAEEVLSMYKELQHLLLNSDEWQVLADDPWSGWIGVSSQDILNNVQKQIEFYDEIVNDYQSAQKNFLENEAIIDLGETLKTTNINTQEAFDSYIQGIKDSTEYSDSYKRILLELANETFPEFSGAMQQTMENSTPGVYIAQLEKLSDIISGLKSSYDALDAAQDDMTYGSGLSPETIEKLAGAEENYLDYLYEENGIIKLNTEAWKENANAKMKSEMVEIQKEIDALRKQNDVLQENIDLYNEKAYGTDNMAEMDYYFRKVNEATAALKNNNAIIEKNQNTLQVYEDIYDNLTGAVGKWSTTIGVYDDAVSALEKLADAQAIVANGYTISAEKARELAAVYPEMLKQATISANGQMVLNAAVVNDFIRGKEAEIKSDAQAEIDKLTAKQALLNAELDIVEEQIKAAESGDDAKVKSANEAAAAQMALEQAVLSACEQAGIDETTANQMATAAMTGDWDTFRELAENAVYDLDDESAIAFNSVMNNFADMSQNMVNNTNEVIGAFSQMGTALKNAMDGMTTKRYNSNIKAGNVSGSGKEAVNNLLTDMFNAEKSDYGDSGTSYEDALSEWQKRLQSIVNDYASTGPDLSALYKQRDSINSQIASVQSQIDLLNSLKNTSLDKFSSGSSKSDSKKEIEEYIATIDDYREAIERLRKAQEVRANIESKIDETDNLKEKILLERQLIGAYEREQEALHNLNNQRDSTITAGAAALRELGFVVKYNADTNELWIENMEHLNELTADSKGEYETLQEATNALRENTEDLIKSLTDLNEENREGSASWWELKNSIKDSRGEILSLLDAIVEQASEAVDSIQDVYDTLHDAADEYAESGYITVDTLQSIIGLGVKYVAYLMDENGQLVINEERIRDVIAARTQQLAIESSLSYIEALRIAKMEGNIATLNNLLYATEEATDATWGFVYASLAMAGLDEQQYQAALNNINAIRALADSAVHSIGQTAGSVTKELESMKDGLDDILKYVMDMLKQRINDQIDALEDMKDAYSEIIDMKKESLEATKDEADYEKKRASKLKEIAKLQARIDALSLDDSRAAQAERAKLLEEMAELQEDLAEDSADKALEATKDALDDMEDAYHKEKDKEIAILEDSISSYQKLYDMA